MKKIWILALFPLALTSVLSSCTLNIIRKNTAPHITKSVSSYALQKKDGTLVDDIKERKTGTFNVIFEEGKEMIPYVSLAQISVMIEPLLKQGFYSTIEESETSTLWKLFKKKEANETEDGLYFASIFSYRDGGIGVGGGVSTAYDFPEDEAGAAITDHCKLDANIINKDDANSVSVYSYSTKDFPCYFVDNVYFLPLGLFEIALSNALGMHICYDYENILLFKDYDNLEDKRFSTAQFVLVDGSKTSVLDQIGKRLGDDPMPIYLAEYNRNCFYFLMENFYGLKDYKGIKSMRSYFKSSSYDEDLLSQDGRTREQALSGALASLEDGHTGLSRSAEVWGEYSEDAVRLSDQGIWKERVQLRTALAAAREEAKTNYGAEPYDVIYSDSEETALFSFNQFVFAPSVEKLVNEDATGFTEEAYKIDTSALVVRQLEEIKANGNVKNVVVDLSTNGGGVIGVLFRVLALLSTDNAAKATYRESNRKMVVEYSSQIDSNFDGIYDLEDVYGDDFNIYYLTSEYTFSCGNALPYFAKLHEYGKTIGHNSGGGSCLVGNHLLPNFQFISHSSTSVFGKYDPETKGFESNEVGAGVDIDIPYNSFYDINYLESRLFAAK